MRGSRAELERRLVLCDHAAAHPEHLGVSGLFFQGVLRALAEDEAKRIRRELRRRDKRRKP